MNDLFVIYEGKELSVVNYIKFTNNNTKQIEDIVVDTKTMDYLNRNFDRFFVELADCKSGNDIYKALQLNPDKTLVHKITKSLLKSKNTQQMRDNIRSYLTVTIINLAKINAHTKKHSNVQQADIYDVIVNNPNLYYYSNMGNFATGWGSYFYNNY